LEIDAKMFVVGKLKSRNICWRKLHYWLWSAYEPSLHVYL